MKSNSTLAEEIRQMQEEKILPVEKKLVAWSLILGIALLGLLVWLSHTYFPGE